MKLVASVLLFLAICFCVTGKTTAQSKKTIILVRHAEKADATSPDPELSAEGKQRAERLFRLIGKYKPGAIYSTDFKRTRDTVEPIAAKRKKTVQTYDAKKPQELIDQIMQSKTKRFIVAGHSNSIPGLANFLVKKDLFKNLDESEYGTIWIIRFKDGKLVEAKILAY